MPKLGMQSIRRRQLIDATLEAINEVGMHDATIAQIARRAGVSTGIISHYFRDKNGLLEATMRDITSQLRDAVLNRLHALPQGSAEQPAAIDSVRSGFQGDFGRAGYPQGFRPGGDYYSYWTMMNHIQKKEAGQFQTSKTPWNKEGLPVETVSYAPVLYTSGAAGRTDVVGGIVVLDTSLAATNQRSLMLRAATALRKPCAKPCTTCAETLPRQAPRPWPNRCQSAVRRRKCARCAPRSTSSWNSCACLRMSATWRTP